MMNFKFHFKYDKKRGLCMTQAGGNKHYDIDSFAGVICEEIAQCLNECFNEWQRSKMKPETRAFLEKIESKEVNNG